MRWLRRLLGLAESKSALKTAEFPTLSLALRPDSRAWTDEPAKDLALQVKMIFLIIMKLIARWPLTDQDSRDWRRAAAKAAHDGTDFFTAASKLQLRFTSGLWGYTIAWIIQDFEAQVARNIEELSEIFKENAVRGWPEQEIAAVCELLPTLSYISQQDPKAPFDAMDSRKIIALAEVLPNDQSPQIFELLMIVAVRSIFRNDFAPARHYLIIWQRLANLLDRAARASGQPQQLTIAAVTSALVALAGADCDPTRRFTALRLCEIAVERLRCLDDKIRAGTLGSLINAFLRRPYAFALGAYFVHDLPDFPNRAEILEVVGRTPWPRRIRSQTFNEYVETISAVREVLAFEFRTDCAADDLKIKSEPTSISVSWNNWRFQHTAYREAVPQHRSLLRERRFDTLILDLIHETTHVLSLDGWLGLATCAYRVQNLEPFAILWRISQGRSATDRDFNDLIATDGLPPLKAGDIAPLPPVLELLSQLQNARVMQDTWTAWFEGLAVFAETASDPSDDDAAINDVLSAVRNFLDFYPENDAIANREIFTTLAKEFDDRVSQAMCSKGASRLYMFFEKPDAPYFAGYLLIRGIVSRWRTTTGRSLCGSKCLKLLLHATQHLTRYLLPGLGMPMPAFREGLIDGFSAFLKILAELPAEDILMFTTHQDPNAHSGPHKWVNGRLQPFAKGAPDEADEQKRLEDKVLEWLRAIDQFAEKSLKEISTTDTNVCAYIEEYMDLLERRRTASLDRSRDIGNVDALLGRLTLLPVGTCEARFDLSVLQDKDFASISIGLRTTEDHVDTGKPSANELICHISKDDSDLIARHYSDTGNPFIKVTRVIDMGSLGVPDGLRFLHFFWLEYGPLRSVEPVTPSSQIVFEILKSREKIKQRIEARLTPNPLQRLEQDILADGQPFARAVLSWLDQSAEWTLTGKPADPGLFEELVRTKAMFLNDEGERTAMQRAAVRAGLNTVYGPVNWIDQAINVGFLGLTDELGGKRYRMLESMAATGRMPGPSPLLDEIAADLTELPIFTKAEFGWDVGPQLHRGGRT